MKPTTWAIYDGHSRPIFKGPRTQILKDLVYLMRDHPKEYIVKPYKG